ncbi:DUF2334 domain-containing protein [Brevibacillus sp. TJ4]|uniref:DUF2334 domain-containing protein n=1 Tax=Brevibacillus sp. TJ4 TaxID=3234853 RepID=UPI003BA1385A
MPRATWSIMFSKIVRLIVLCGLVLVPLAWPVTAGKAHSGSAEAGERKLLVVFSNANGDITETVRTLDVALGHFADDIVFTSDDRLTSVDMKTITHLIYYGEVKRQLPEESLRILSGFAGPMLVIGENIEQFPRRFPLDAKPQTGTINKVSKPADSSFYLLQYNYPIAEIAWSGAETILQGWRGEYAFPVMLMKDDSAIFALKKLDYRSLYLLAEGLHAFFREQHAAEHLAYIRLEDVHPYSDPDLVKQAGDYLAERNIPFMIALIPVYTNPETGKQVHLEDVPELVAVLKELQEKGASIILHGYTHQYRSSETGEGFEFWDVENDIPIAGEPDEQIVIKRRHEFASQADYDAYREELRQFDHMYTKTRLESGIRELTSLGLYPVAFEPPHYNMSQEGYRTTAEYFPFLVGQVQMGDNTWMNMLSAPYISRPSFLHGMTLLPETIGFYDPASVAPLHNMKEGLHDVMFVRDAMIGMFYHPYLGLEHLQEMIALVQTVPNLKWIDLKNMAYTEREKFTAVSCYEKPCERSEFGSDRLIGIVLWVIVAIVSLAVAAFIVYTVRIRMELRKQLFEERGTGG